MEPVELLMLVEDAVEDLVELLEAAAKPVREAGPRCLRHQFECQYVVLTQYILPS